MPIKLDAPLRTLIVGSKLISTSVFYVTIIFTLQADAVTETKKISVENKIMVSSAWSALTGIKLLIYFFP